MRGKRQSERSACAAADAAGVAGAAGVAAGVPLLMVQQPSSGHAQESRSGVMGEIMNVSTLCCGVPAAGSTVAAAAHVARSLAWSSACSARTQSSTKSSDGGLKTSGAISGC